MSMKTIKKKPKKSRSKSIVVKTQAETAEHEADEIVNGLWLGNCASATAEFIASKKISHVLNITPDLPFPAATALSGSAKIVCLRIPVRSENAYVSDFMSSLPKALDLIHRARTAGGNVLVHCKKGHTRSAVVVFAYLTEKLKFRSLAAKRLIWSQRPNALGRTIKRSCLMQAVGQKSVNYASEKSDLTKSGF